MYTQLKRDAEARMQKSLVALQTELTKLRTGRAHPSLLDHVMVSYYGTDTPISQIANIHSSDARTLTINPWEKSMVSAVEKAIRESNLGLNPISGSDGIRVPLPALNEERRKELTKIMKQEGETARVAVRNIRRDANTQLKEMLKAKTITEDEERRYQDEIQKLTDKCISEVDSQLAKKETELMEV